jgi:hypothetical protein
MAFEGTILSELQPPDMHPNKEVAPSVQMSSKVWYSMSYSLKCHTPFKNISSTQCSVEMFA